MLGPNWKFALDASALVGTSTFDISVVQPDFFIVSFYKIFGYPTGIGALIVRNECAEECLKKQYFGGGSVNYVTDSFVDFRTNLSQRYLAWI